MTTESSIATRQPPVAKLSLSSNSTALADMPPSAMPRLASDIQNARDFRFEPNSASSADAPPNSPPSPMPCRMRRTTRRTGAAIPSVAYPGKEACQARGEADEGDVDEEGELASCTIAEVAKDKRAQEPGGKTGTERQIRKHQGFGRRQVGKEDGRESAGGRVTVQEEIVELDHHPGGGREGKEDQRATARGVRGWQRLVRVDRRSG